MAKAQRVNLREFQQALSERLRNKTAAQVGAARLGLLAAGERWLVRLSHAGEVIQAPPITPVPLTQSWFLGVTNIRGSLYSVTDFSRFIGREPTLVNAQSRLLLFGQRFAELRAGLLVQQVVGLRNVAGWSKLEAKVEFTGETPWDWLGVSWQAPGGEVWREIDLGRLARSPSFLKVGV